VRHLKTNFVIQDPAGTTPLLHHHHAQAGADPSYGRAHQVALTTLPAGTAPTLAATTSVSGLPTVKSNISTRKSAPLPVVPRWPSILPTHQHLATPKSATRSLCTYCLIHSVMPQAMYCAFYTESRDPVHCSQIQTESVLVATASLVLSLVATAEDGVPELSKRGVHVGGGWK
jgi:hypothetical protein